MEPSAVVVDGVLGPEPPEQRQGFVEDLRAVTPLDPEGLLLDRVRDTEPEGRKRATVRQHVERRPLLGDERGRTAGQHRDAGAELDAPRTRGGEGQCQDRIGRRATDALGQPH